MITDEHSTRLARIPADRRLVEDLYWHGKITREARTYALDLLYPRNRWGQLVSWLLLGAGTALILSGIVYFFAFNWSKITPTVKFSSIEFAILGCLLGAYFCSLQRLSGQLLLLAGSVLVGVFLAVFGQIYQTGADAYQLFLLWSLLTFGWTVISNFAAQWFFWLTISNIFLVLWCQQTASLDGDMASMYFTYMAILNGGALALREYCATRKGFEWLTARWIRLLLTLATLLVMLVPILLWIIDDAPTPISIEVGGVIGLFGHGAVYYIYRNKLPDMWSLTATVLSACMIVETYLFVYLGDGELWRIDDAAIFLSLGLLTVGLFSLALIYLRNVAKRLGAGHV